MSQVLDLKSLQLLPLEQTVQSVCSNSKQKIARSEMVQGLKTRHPLLNSVLACLAPDANRRAAT
jgi:hypothetical protein